MSLAEFESSGADVLAAVLAVNAAHERETSPLSGARLAAMVDAAFAATYARDEAGSMLGVLIAFDQRAHYDSRNFLWFRRRVRRFAYVDRVIVAPAARGRGVARMLYADLFDRAVAAGLGQVVCEVNLRPPNPASDAFHAALGFSAMGSAWLGPDKAVRYLARRVP